MDAGTYVRLSTTDACPVPLACSCRVVLGVGSCENGVLVVMGGVLAVVKVAVTSVDGGGWGCAAADDAVMVTWGHGGGGVDGYVHSHATPGSACL